MDWFGLLVVFICIFVLGVDFLLQMKWLDEFEKGHPVYARQQKELKAAKKRLKRRLYKKWSLAT